MASFLRSAAVRSSLGLRAGSPRAFGGAKAFGACDAPTSWGLLEKPASLSQLKLKMELGDSEQTEVDNRRRLKELMHPFARAHGLSSFAASGELLGVGNDACKKLMHGRDVTKGVRTFQTSASSQSKMNRPLSPHLTVYRPEMSSMSSITNRITAGLVSVGIAGGIFVLKVADTSLSFYPVYSLVFFSQQIPYWLILSVGNFALLALVYHVVHSLRRELQQWGIIKFKV